MAAGGHAVRVLIVDDSETAVSSLLEELRHSGYEPVHEWARSLKALASALDAQPWDLAIVSYSLTGFSGLAGLALLNERNPDLAVIMVSESVDENVAAEVMGAGARDLIPKDNLARLKPIIERELGATLLSTHSASHQTDADGGLQAGPARAPIRWRSHLPMTGSLFLALLGALGLFLLVRQQELDLFQSRLNDGAASRYTVTTVSWTVLAWGIVSVILAGLYYVNRVQSGARSEGLVQQRTAELSAEIRRRKRTEEALHSAHVRLSDWVARLNARNKEMTLLSQMSELLQSCVALEDIYPIAGRFLKEMFPEEAGALYFVAETSSFLDSRVTWGADPPTATTFSPDDCWALRRGRPHLVEDPDAGPICPHVRLDKPHPYLCVPVAAQGEVLGVLHLESSRVKEGGAQAAERSALGGMQQLSVAIADQMGLAVANLKLRMVLRQQAIRDPLTGLFNRRYLEESLEREIHRARRNKAQMGIIMMDIDHFKPLNDTYGHEVGDEVLRVLGSFIQARIRGSDIPCRFGGEEFVLILPGASLETARQRAEELRAGTEQISVKFGERAIGPVTASFGVAVFPDHGETRDSVLTVADSALYQAKKQGRNRVVVTQG